MRVPRCSVAVSLIGFAFGPVDSAFAQEARDSLDPLELPSLEVTATHFPLSHLELPVTAEVIGREELEAFGAVSLPDVLAQLPGVHVRNGSGSPAAATIDLRGQGETAGQRVLVLVNGRRLNRPDMGGVNWLQIPTSQIARVEVLKGGQGVIYGDQAIGGVIKITTRRPFQAGGEGSVLAGSYGLRQGTLSAHYPAGPRDQLQVDASWLEQDGYRENSAFRGTSVGIDWTHNSPSGWEWNQHLQWVETDAERPGPLYSTGFPAHPRRSTIGGQHNEERHWILDTRAGHSDLLGGALEVPLNLQDQQLAWSLPGAWGDNHLRTAQLRPRHEWELGEFTLTTGLDGIYDDFAFTGWDSAARRRAVSKAELTRTATSGYAHAHYQLEENWRLTAGLRVEHWRVAAESQTRSNQEPEAPFESEYDESVRANGTAGTLGTVWQPRPDFRAWARYDRLFRFPVTDELASYQGYALAVPFNRDLEAETGHALEFGTGWQWDAWFFQGVLFGQRLDNEIQYDPLAFLNRNLPGSDRLGVEISAERSWERLHLRLSWTQIEAEFREGRFRGYTPALVPARQGRASVRWTPLDWLEVSGALRYTGRQYEGNYLALVEAGLSNPDPYLPSATVADASVRVLFGDHWTIRGVVENVFDTDYATVKYQGGWYPASGRSWKLQVTATF